MDQSKLPHYISFLEILLLEESREELDASKNCKKERWSICESCEHFDEPEEDVGSVDVIYHIR